MNLPDIITNILNFVHRPIDIFNYRLINRNWNTLICKQRNKLLRTQEMFRFLIKCNLDFQHNFTERYDVIKKKISDMYHEIDYFGPNYYFIYDGDSSPIATAKINQIKLYYKDNLLILMNRYFNISTLNELIPLFRHVLKDNNIKLPKQKPGSMHSIISKLLLKLTNRIAQELCHHPKTLS